LDKVFTPADGSKRGRTHPQAKITRRKGTPGRDKTDGFGFTVTALTMGGEKKETHRERERGEREGRGQQAEQSKGHCNPC
jgi:hypothetical protein